MVNHVLKRLLRGRRSAPAQDTGYCLKCRSEQPRLNAEKVVMKNGRPAVRGTCGTCGGKMFKIGT